MSSVTPASAAYLRLEVNSVAQVVFIGSKTKVVPLKTISIPRLELKAAVLGTRQEKITKICIRCRVVEAAPRPPGMASLPELRLTPFIRAFTFVGLDYFGPVFDRAGRSLVERWVAVFTCLTIRAEHLEVVHSLSTESCIMALRRFVYRRGPPREFYTDNGTCFQGASRELKEEMERRNEALALTFTSVETSWKFIPPAAPHMGGVWERLVRSVKVATGAILDAARKPDDAESQKLFY